MSNQPTPYITIRRPLLGFTPDLKLCLYYSLCLAVEKGGVVPVENVVRKAITATTGSVVRTLPILPPEAKKAIIRIVMEENALLLQSNVHEKLHPLGLFLAKQGMTLDGTRVIDEEGLAPWKQELARMI